jgi:hypothetical protein
MGEKINRYIISIIKLILFYSAIFLPSVLHAFPAVENLPSRNMYFSGRTVYLNGIQEKLIRYNTVYLTGYGGVGKSQLAKEYGHINYQKYDLIWWFDAKSDLRIQYENLLIYLSNSKQFENILRIDVKSISPNVILDFTNNLLSGCKCRWLLIFDNANDIKELSYQRQRPRGKTLLLQQEKRIFLEAMY